MTGGSTISWPDATERFVAELANNGTSPATVSAYLADLRQLREQLRPVQPGDVTIAHLNGFIERLRCTGYKPASIARKASAIRRFFDYLDADDLVQPNPALSLLPLERATKLGVVHDRETVVGILADMMTDPTPIGRRDLAIGMLLAETGIRVSDLTGMRLRDVDLAGRRITVSQGTVDERAIEISRELAGVLARYVGLARPELRDRPTDVLFLSHLGEPLSRQWTWKTMQKRGLTPSGLRNAAVASLLRTDTPFAEIAARLGMKHQRIRVIASEIGRASA